MTNDSNTTVSTPILLGWPEDPEIVLQNCVLVAETGPDGGRNFAVVKELTTIGRRLWSDIALNDPTVSKQHCELEWTRDGLCVRDLGSTNGVHCQGLLKNGAVVLGPNARFQVGSTRLRVELLDGHQVLTSQTKDPTGSLIGASPIMRRLFSTVERVAAEDIPVLLLGETGTGKTVIAEALHKMSLRRDGPLVVANCPELGTLTESRLFGHVRGAFTGADRDAPGMFHEADGGTLFLDEIGDLAPEVQAKLLRAVEAGRIRPLGAAQELAVNVRVICATNRDLAGEVAAKRFRQDLYERIAGIELTVPPLRERVEDIPLLARRLVTDECNRRRLQDRRCDVATISPRALRALECYAWPGNVRALQKVIKRAMVLAEGPSIEFEDLLLSPSLLEEEAATPGQRSGRRLAHREWKAALVEPEERRYFQGLLEDVGWSVPRAAEESGLSRTYVRSMMKKYGLGRDGG